MSATDVSSDRKLRILHVLRAPLGGLFRHVLDLTKQQVAGGHSVGLVVDSLSCGEQAAAHLAALEPSLALGIKRMPMQRRPHPYDLAGIYQVHRHASKMRADVVHGHGAKGGLYARAPGLLLRKGGPIRCYTPHGGSFNQTVSPIVEATYMGVERLLANVTDVLLFESVYISDCFRSRVGDTRALVRIVQNGIGEAEFVPVPPNPDAADLVYVGELRAIKGIDTLLDAIVILSRKFDRPLRLMLVGSGPEKEALQDYARARGLADQVTFAGAYPARQAFAQGKILAVPSRGESLPYIVLEAAGAQIPTVATNVGGINEIFGPYRDRLIPPDDAALLATTIENMMRADPKVRAREAADLAAFVASRFSISIMTDSVIAGYRDALARRATSFREAKRPYAVTP